MALSEPTSPRGAEARAYADAIWKQYRSGEIDLDQAALAVLTTVMVYVAEMADAATKDGNPKPPKGATASAADIPEGRRPLLARLTRR